MLKSPRLAIYKKAEVQKRAFIATVNRYNADAKRGPSIRLDTNADYTWTDVLSAQESFFQARQGLRSDGVRGFMHKHLQRFGHNSETFQSWLKLLPTESHYLSVLCGGLTLILGVGRLRHLETRDLPVLTFHRLQNRCRKFEKVSATSLMICR